jgi:putative protease
MKKPELLAPAGNLTSAIVAFESGADAVYAGLEKFNARAKGKNFTYKDMSKLSNYCKKINKKLYITLNTILKESEVPEIAYEISKIALLEPDALIIQDLGVARIAKQVAPELTLHASTQMGIHNSLGVKMAEELGISRVILERELTFEEIKEITENSNIEVELFIHGALCSSLSAHCLWSSWIGGWSGNRGFCKQVCRRRFHNMEGKEKKSGFFFSANDMYGVEYIENFIELGISSLKIEGRLKDPSYVSNVVKAYKLLLDSDKNELKKNIKEAKNILSHSLGRKWTNGFLEENSFKDVIRHDSAGTSGARCGEVLYSNKHGFSMRVDKRLQKGDKIRIQTLNSENTPSITITKMSVNNKLTNNVRKGEQVFISYDRPVQVGGKVYKIASVIKDYEKLINSLEEYTPKTNIDISVELTDKGLSLEINQEKSFYQIEVQNAEKRSLTSTDLEKAFEKSCPKNMNISSFSAEVFGSFFIPAAILKNTVKQIWNDISNFKIKSKEKIQKEMAELFMQQYKQTRPISLAKEKESCKTAPKGDLPKKKYTIIVRSIYNYDNKTSEIELPHFCLDKNIDNLKGRILDAYNKGIKRFRVTSLFQFELLKELKDIAIVVSHPFPVVNSETVAYLKQLGVVKAQASLELNKSELDQLILHSELPIELYRYGRPFLYATRAEILVEGKINDSRGDEFYIEKDKNSKITYVYPTETLSLPKVRNTVEFFDLSHAWWKETKIKDFNFNHELK